MSAETLVIKRLAKALQEIAELSKVRVNDDIESDVFVLTEDLQGSCVTGDMKFGLDYAANMAREALKGIVVT